MLLLLLEMNQDTEGGYLCHLASSAPQSGGQQKRTMVVYHTFVINICALFYVWIAFMVAGSLLNLPVFPLCKQRGSCSSASLKSCSLVTFARGPTGDKASLYGSCV